MEEGLPQALSHSLALTLGKQMTRQGHPFRGRNDKERCGICL